MDGGSQSVSAASSRHVSAFAKCHSVKLGAKSVDVAHIWCVNINRTGIDIVLDSGSRIRATPEEWDAAMRRLQVVSTQLKQ
jgi:hypothetical protein